MKKNISILGSTGSIGKQVLEVVAAYPSAFKVIAIAGKDEVEILCSQIKTFKPLLVSVSTEDVKNKLEQALQGEKIKILVGEVGLLDAATHKDADLVVVAIPGALPLQAVMQAVDAKKNIALATKEVLVAAGDVFMEAVKASNVKVFPIDSEHSAIAQCLAGEKQNSIKKLILTASGGPFLKTTIEKMEKMTAKDALAHPTWKMGPKITVDSATLMNKGFEVMEAHYLFNIPYGQIEVVIHPQSIIHSMVEFVDGSVKAQLGAPDMRVPIQYALFGMERSASRWNKLDITKVGALTFEKPDKTKFPCLEHAYEAGKKGGTMPAVLNAANEEAVNAFLRGKISFGDIAKIIRKTMDCIVQSENPDLAKILEADSFARKEARNLITATA